MLPEAVSSQTDFMAEGYCVKCKAKKEIAEAVEEVMKNGRKAIKGKCPTCGVVMFKILGGKAAVVPAPAGSPVPAPKGVNQPS
jgi:Zn finger protein HypA/HybF involved in hydrogenase expression